MRTLAKAAAITALGFTMAWLITALVAVWEERRYERG